MMRCWQVYTMTHHYWFSHFIFFFLFFPSFTSLLLSSSPLMTVTDQQHLHTSILKYFYIPMSMICWWIVFSHTCTRKHKECRRLPVYRLCTSVLIHIPPVIVRSLLLSPSSFLRLSLSVFVFLFILSIFLSQCIALVCVRLWRLGVVSTKFCWHCIAWTLFLYHEMLKKMYYRNNHVLMKNLTFMLLWLLACDWCAWWVCMRDRKTCNPVPEVDEQSSRGIKK